MMTTSAPRAPRGGWWRWSVRGATVLGALVSLGMFAAGYVSVWPVDLVVHFPGIQLVALGIAVGLALVRWQHGCLLVLLVAALVPAGQLWLTPRAAPSSAVPATAPVETMRIAVTNVRAKNDAHDRLVAWLEAEAPDVVVMVEATTAWVDAVQQSTLRFPYAATELNEAGNFGIAVFSRRPMQGAPTIRAAGPQSSPALRVTFDVHDAPLALYAIHPPPPGRPWSHAARDEQLDALGRLVGQDSADHVFVAGDFNSALWSAAGRSFVAQRDLRDVRLGSMTLGGTWPASWPAWARAPIDHLLIDEACAVEAFAVGPDLGSDHRPIVATVTIVERRD